MTHTSTETEALERCFERRLVEQCAPTLAGIKPGSLFPLSAVAPEHIVPIIQNWDECLRPWGIHLTILKHCPTTGNCIVYMYRTNWLERILHQPDVADFLQSYSYPADDVDSILKELSRRYCVEQDMPHEIGIFLGYPLADVQGFIRHKGKNCLCCGCWKCYSDAESAQRCFQRYHACTAQYRALYASGTPIIQLVVAA